MLHINELSNVNTLHERKVCIRLRTSEQVFISMYRVYYISMYRVYYVSTDNTLKYVCEV
jgi:hypothetical protein